MAPAGRPLGQGPKVQEQAVRVEGLGPQHLPSREGQKLLGQLLASACGTHRSLGKSYDPLRVLRLADHHVEASDDDRQQIIEVVRDASGQLPDGLHLLGLPQCILGHALLGPIEDDAGHSDGTAVAVVFRPALGGDPPDRAIGA